MNERSRTVAFKGTARLDATPAAVTTDGAELLRLTVCPVNSKLQHSEYGELDFSADVADALVRNFQSYGCDVPIDVDHGTDAPFAAPGSGEAVGWLERPKALRIEGEHLIAYARPTERGLALVKTGAYRLTSPTIDFDFISPTTGESQGPTLLALALTNRPFIRGQQPARAVDRSSVALRAPGGNTMAVADTGAPAAPAPQASTVTLADHSAALAAVKTEAAAQLAAISAERDSIKSLLVAEQARAKKFADDAASAMKKCADMENANAEAAAKGKVDAIISSGKVTEAQRAALMELCMKSPGLVDQLYPMSAAPVVPMSQVGVQSPAAPPEPKTGKASLAQDTAAIFAGSRALQAEMKARGSPISFSDALSATLLKNPQALIQKRGKAARKGA
jgi:hypothetical protein